MTTGPLKASLETHPFDWEGTERAHVGLRASRLPQQNSKNEGTFIVGNQDIGCNRVLWDYFGIDGPLGLLQGAIFCPLIGPSVRQQDCPRFPV